MKRFFVSVLLCVLISIPTVQAADTGLFQDVNVMHANRAAILSLYGQNIINGYDNGTFQPDKSVNRAELMQIVAQMKGYFTLEKDVLNNCFPDVKDEWFAPAVCFGKSNEWINGYPDGTFKPAQSVSRVEALKIILNAFYDTSSIEGLLGNDKADNLPADIDSSAWYHSYTDYVFLHNLVDKAHVGVDNFYKPHDGMTRKEVAQLIYNIQQFGYVGDEHLIDKAPLVYFFPENEYEVSTLSDVYFDKEHQQIAEVSLINKAESKYAFNSPAPSVDMLSKIQIKVYDNSSEQLTLEDWMANVLEPGLGEAYIGPNDVSPASYATFSYTADLADEKGKYYVIGLDKMVYEGFPIQNGYIVVMYVRTPEDFILRDFENLFKLLEVAYG